MKIEDILGFAMRSLRGYPLRTGLMLLAMLHAVALLLIGKLFPGAGALEAAETLIGSIDFDEDGSMETKKREGYF